MIVRPEEDALVLVKQTDHARHVGELAANLAEPPPGDISAFIAAARLHDNGWREYEEAPLLDAGTGTPYAYRGILPEPYREIWKRGIDRAVAIDPRVGLLVSLHGMQFFERKRLPEDRAFHEAERAREGALLRALGLEGTWDALPSEVRGAHEWIRFLDGLSLFVLDRWESPWRAEVDGIEVEVTREGPSLLVDPWPFRDPFSLEVPALELPRPRYGSQEAFLQDLAQARPIRIATTFDQVSRLRKRPPREGTARVSRAQ